MCGMRHIMKSQKNIASGFTLIELLVVIAIIAILAALLVPAVKSALEKGTRVTCLSYERQLFLASRMFSDAHDGFLPSRGVTPQDNRWPAALADYLDGNTQVYYCPRARQDPERREDPYANDHNNTSYVINGFNDAIQYNTPSAMFLDRLPMPALTIVFGEAVNGDANFYMDLVEGNEKKILDEKRHNGGAIYVFGDGHAVWIEHPLTVTEHMWWVNKNLIPNSS